MAMTKRKIRLEDGRYLIYFEFGKTANNANTLVKKAAGSIRGRSSTSKRGKK